MNRKIIKEVRENKPLIHHLTNQVVMNFTANGLLAFGASPVMAKAEQEAAEMASKSDGLLINIGTLTEADKRAMILAGKAANEQKIPVVLDPVGVAATAFRTETIHSILAEVHPTVIKGNASELAHLVDIPVTSKGVESTGQADVEKIAGEVARKYQTVAVITGETDVICSNDKLIKNHTGHPILTNITGAGCLLGSIITACLTAQASTEEKVQAALEFYAKAAENAMTRQEVSGPGTFLPAFIDALAMEPGDENE